MRTDKESVARLHFAVMLLQSQRGPLNPSPVAKSEEAATSILQIFTENELDYQNVKTTVTRHPTKSANMQPKRILAYPVRTVSKKRKLASLS